MPLFSAISKFQRSVRAVVQSIEALLFIEGEIRIFLLFHRVFHRAVEMPEFIHFQPFINSLNM